MRPSTLFEAVQRHRDGGEPLAVTLSEFLDEFYVALTSDTARAQHMIADEPPGLDDNQQHALLGAIGEHLARRWNLQVPSWTDDPSRFLHRAYFTSPIQGLKALMIAESPLAFRRRMIFTEAEPLRRARMPTAGPS